MANQNLQRPNRNDYVVHVVLAPNGQIVDEKQWGPVLGNAQGKDRRRVLKENGWTEAKTFNQEEYDAAMSQFRDQSKTAVTNQRKQLFDQIFDDAAVEPHPRLESALRTLLPSMDNSNERRMIKALVNVCIAVDGLLKPVQRGGNRRGVSKTQETNQVQQGRSRQDSDTDDEGHRINKDGTVDKRTKGDNEEKAQGQQTREEHGLQGRSKDDDQGNQGQQGNRRQARGRRGNQGEAGLGGEENGTPLTKAGEPDQRFEDTGQGGTGRGGQAEDGTPLTKSGEPDRRFENTGQGVTGLGGQDNDGTPLTKDGEPDQRFENTGQGQSGLGGTADNNQALTKEGNPDRRTKGDDMEEAPGQETRREHGLQGTSANGDQRE